MADWRLDQKTEETPAESDITILTRNTSTFKTTFKKIKEFIIGSTALTTTANTITGAIEEIKGKVDSNTASLNERMKNISSITKKIITSSTTVNVKIIGDSITVGTGGTGIVLDGEIIYGTNKVNTSGHCWANTVKTYLESNFNCICKNYGVSGINSNDIVAHLSDLIRTEDNIVICAIGINDRLNTDAINNYLSNLEIIYNYCINNGKDIIFVQPMQPNSEGDSVYLYKARQIANALNYFCTNKGIEYIPTYFEFSNMYKARGYKLVDVLADNIHPNDKGYDFIAYIILKYMGFAIREDEEDSGWITATLSNGSNSTGNELSYRKESSLLTLQGWVTGFTTVPTVITILPIGFRPRKNIFKVCSVGDGTFALLYITTTGSVQLNKYTGTISASQIFILDELSFHVN